MAPKTKPSNPFNPEFFIFVRLSSSLSQIWLLWNNRMVDRLKPYGENLLGIRKREEEGALWQIIVIINSKPVDDLLQWKHNQGSYSSSHGYKILTLNNDIEEPIWRLIWKCKVPPRIKTFLWKFQHKVMPTKSLLQHKGINVNPICSWCGSALEEQNHLFGIVC